AANALARSIGEHADDEAATRVVLDLAAATGFYAKVRLVRTDGGISYERHAAGMRVQAPKWFTDAMSINPPTGIASIVDGLRTVGRLEVSSQVGWAHERLWQSCLRLITLLGAAAVVVGVAATLALQRIRLPLKAAVAQSQALVDGRFISVPEPHLPELRELTRAMNTMVARVKSVFEGQVAQLEALRIEAHADALTGLANRKHFVARLSAALEHDDGPQTAGLVLLRLRDLTELNRSLGHAVADGALACIAHVLQTYAERVNGCFAGRLNGSDFALSLPVPDLAYETGVSLADTLRVALPALGPGMRVAVGVVEVHRHMGLTGLMGTADAALARSESRGPFSVELGSDVALASIGPGEGAWRHRIDEALKQGRTLLATFVVVDAQRQLVHLECSLRLQLETDGPFEPAAHWLPLAVRGRQTPLLDERTVLLALNAIHADGQRRCVNLSQASLLDSGFAARLRALLQEWPRAARQLSLDIAETAAMDHFSLLQEFSRQVRPTGVRVGLEHAGERLARIERLFEAGLDYVKLDASVTQDCAGDARRLEFVKANAAMLHALSMQVYAEGVASAVDVQALWTCGIDGVSGPWATAASGEEHRIA
ncbi:MAG: hypothetical protein JWP52_3806, partial [Rhizobacter sp.]|nr:hypothetical protein [Rhizobacter sp.]